MRALFRAIGRPAQAPLAVLITGETGTGKELVANALHRESPRAHGPFVALNTAAIPSELLESELFGHEAGAFTGAQRRHTGRFEQADGGTLFLDEIGDMPLPLQTRLLRVLAQGEFFRVGGRELIRVDVRVVAATPGPGRAGRAGKFRADLLHRLDVVRLQLPPLRERREDIAQLASTFLAAAARRLDTPPKRLTAAALQALREHDWPGNVRELENVCWRMAALAAADTIGVADVDTALNRTRGGRGSISGADPGQWEALLAEWARRQLAEGVEGLHAQVRERVDHALLEAALQITHGRRAEAAARLGLGRNTLTRKLGAGRRRGAIERSLHAVLAPACRTVDRSWTMQRLVSPARSLQCVCPLPSCRCPPPCCCLPVAVRRRRPSPPAAADRGQRCEAGRGQSRAGLGQHCQWPHRTDGGARRHAHHRPGRWPAADAAGRLPHP